LFTLKKGIIDETTYTIEPGSGGDTLFTISKDIFSFTDRIHVYKGEDVSLFGSEDPIITVDADWLSGWNRTFYEGNGSKVIAETEPAEAHIVNRRVVSTRRIVVYSWVSRRGQCNSQRGAEEPCLRRDALP
jgi:hypothetical protein